MKKYNYIYYIFSLFLFSIADIGLIKAVTIDQADVCGAKSTYKDEISIEDVIASKNKIYLEEGMGNKDYCPVYCIEEIEFEWPGFKPTVNAGSHFTWTVGENSEINGTTAIVHGNRNCRTHIDLEKWEKAYNKNLEDIIKELKTMEKEPETSKLCGLNTSPALAGCYEKFDGVTKESHSMTANADGKTFKTATGDMAMEVGGETVIEEVEGDVNVVNQYQIWKILNIVKTSESTYNVEFEISTYVRLCPCKWKSESEATIGLATYATGTIDKQKYKSLFGFEPSDVSSTNTSPTITLTHDELGCSNLGGTIVSGPNGKYCDGGFHSISPNAEASTVASWIYGNYKATYSNPNTCGCSEWNTRGECTNQKYNLGVTFSEKNSCESAGGGTWKEVRVSCKEGHRYYCQFVSDEYKITQIKQQKCKGVSGMEKITEDCKTLGKKCKTGYHYDENLQKCWKNDVSYLKTLETEQQNLIDILKSCSSFNSTSYDLKTEISVDYEEPKYGNVPDKDSQKLEQTKKNSTSKENWRVADTTTTKIVPYKRCVYSELKRYCVDEIRDISTWWLIEYGQLFSSNYEYNLPNDENGFSFYRWVTVPGGLSLSTEPKTGDYSKYGRYIDIGYPNYPVHFNTPPKTPNYQLDLIFDKVGFANRFSNQIYNGNYNEINGKTVNVINKNGKKIVYDCEYEVKEKEFAPSDAEKVKIIYRPISLDNPFPGITGNGRNTGNNWCELNGDNTQNCSNNNAKVEKYIKNNRGVTTNDVYSKEPMYQITLNAQLINKIRDYNKLTNYDDFNLYCNTGTVDKTKTGKECRSHFVVGGMMDTTLPSLKDNDYVTGCGTNSDFNYCDIQDGIER